MARQRKKLGQYIKDRKEKFRKQKIPNFLVHVSNSPRRILYPKIISFAWDIKDSERTRPLLFLSPVQEISNWLSWCYNKDFCLLFIYIVRPKKDLVFKPKIRYNEEFVTLIMQKPLEIIPIRYYPESDYANLH